MYDERRRNGELAAAKEEGLEQGRREKLEAFKNMKDLGVAIEFIAQATGLSIEEVEKL